jgi:hypothetical protein
VCVRVSKCVCVRARVHARALAANELVERVVERVALVAERVIYRSSIGKFAVNAAAPVDVDFQRSFGVVGHFQRSFGVVLGFEGHDPVVPNIGTQPHNLGPLPFHQRVANLNIILLELIQWEVAQDEGAHREVWISFRYRHFAHLSERVREKERE